MAAPMKIFVAVYFAIIASILGTVFLTPVSNVRRSLFLRALFVIVIETVLLGGSIFVWKELLAIIGVLCRQPLLKKCCMVLVLLFLVATQISYLTNLYFMDSEPHWFSYSCYACLGTFIQLGIWLAVSRIINWFIGKFTGRPAQSRLFLASIAVVYSISVAMYGLYKGSQLPPVKQVTIDVKNLGDSFDGLRIVEISDIHLGPTVGKTRLKGIVSIINSLNPDIVVLVGDLTDGPVKKLHAAASPLKDIQSKYGSFYVTGNHEYHTGDVDNWFRYMREMGFNVLHNSNMKIVSEKKKQDYFYLAGTDDIFAGQMRYEGHGFDLDKTMEGTEAHKAVILLAHQPKAAKMALDSEYKNIQLVLSGHTHGGQMFPISIGAYLMNPFYVGLYRYRDRSVYVSSGTVFWGIPMRIFTSMAITEITLQNTK